MSEYLLSRAEACRLYNISERIMIYLVDEHKIETELIGKRLYIVRRSLENFLKCVAL